MVLANFLAIDLLISQYLAIAQRQKRSRLNKVALTGLPEHLTPEIMLCKLLNKADSVSIPARFLLCHQ